jgi:hypothetical protein
MMAVLVAILVFIYLTVWVTLKAIKIGGLLIRFNNRNGIKVGFYSPKAKNLKELKALIKRAKEYDKEQRERYAGQ